MEPKESHQYMKWCNDKEIRIYPIPLYENGHSYKICVERDGKASVGKITFENKSSREQKSVWDQIRELYKIIYQREKKIENE